MRMRTLAVTLAVSLSSPLVLAETAPPAGPPPRPSWKDKLFVGGGIGASFGTVDYLEVAPLVGYRFTPRLSGGVGLFYRWKQDDRYDLETSDYGGNLFARVAIVPQIFADVEYEYLDYEYPVSQGVTIRSSDSNFLAGLGFTQPMGRNGSFYASALYNFSYSADDPTEPYDGPWVYRVGFTVGF